MTFNYIRFHSDITVPTCILYILHFPQGFSFCDSGPATVNHQAELINETSAHAMYM